MYSKQIRLHSEQERLYSEQVGLYSEKGVQGAGETAKLAGGAVRTVSTEQVRPTVSRWGCTVSR